MATQKARAKIKKAVKTFRATLERAGNLGWTIVYLPFAVHDTWGTRAQIRVKGEVNGFPFRTSAFPTKRGVHFLMINRKMQKGGRAAAGTTATFRVEPDLEERTIPESKELRAALNEDKKLKAWYEKNLPESARREIAKWVNAGKQAETRLRRAAQLAERVYSTMEAEQELPPLIRRAMEENPKAYAGWKQMTAAMRRGELLAIFYYRNPESQRRRIAKVLERALEYAEKKGKA